MKFIPTKGMLAPDNFAKRMFQDITETDSSSVTQSLPDIRKRGTVSKSFYEAWNTIQQKRKIKDQSH